MNVIWESLLWQTSCVHVTDQLYVSFLKLSAGGGLHRQTVWELSAGGAKDQALSAQLPWLASPCLPLLHLPLRSFPQIPGPGHNEEIRQQGRRRITLCVSLFNVYYIRWTFIYFVGCLKQHFRMYCVSQMRMNRTFLEFSEKCQADWQITNFTGAPMKTAKVPHINPVRWHYFSLAGSKVWSHIVCNYWKNALIAGFSVSRSVVKIGVDSIKCVNA